MIVTNLYPDARQPAFGTFVAAHADALRRAGADVAVVAIVGVPVHRAVARKYTALFLRAVAAALRARWRRARPDVVEAHVAYPTALLALVAARLAGASLVVYCHGSDVTGIALRSRLHHRLARWVFSRADLVVANSGYIRDLLEARYRVNPRRLTVLPPGLDLSLFSGPAMSRRPGEILYVGRLSSQKGVHELIRAVAGLKDPSVAIRFVGDGPERAALEREASSAGLSAEFMGPLPQVEVAGLMRQAAVIAMPSTYPEGLGLVALEAMAAGAMTVATAAGALGESVEHGVTGWLVPPGDVAALSVALGEALAMASAADPTQRVALQERAAAAARRHDIDAIGERTIAAYAALGAH